MRTFVEYQLAAWKTALPTAKNTNYMGLKLASEAGEIAGKLGKQIRGDFVTTEAIAAEIGDVLWYCAGLASVLGLSLEQIALDNIAKLQNRQKDGKLQGDGDSR